MPWGAHTDVSDNPEGAHVRVCSIESGKVITIPVIDIGPAKWASKPGQIHAIDLTQAAFRKLGGSKSAGLLRVRFRILAGARWIGKQVSRYTV